MLDASWSSIAVLERYDELLSWLIERPDNAVNLFKEVLRMSTETKSAW